MTEEAQGVEPAPDAAPIVDSSPAPQESETPVETVLETTQEPKADDAGLPRDEDGKFISPKLQQRIDRLTWEREQAKREAEFFRQQAQPKPEPVKAEEPAPKVPTLEEHGYDEGKYQAALLKYAVESARSEVRKEIEQQRTQEREQKRLETFVERQKAFAKSAPDFQERVSDPTLPITEGMRDVILDSDSGPEIAYYLATNREAAAAIARLPPHLAALEMGRIEGRMQAQKDVAKAASRVPAVSKAPPPPPKVEEVEATLTGVKASSADSDKLSTDEWMRLREKETRRKKA